jgi:hypothetical protein
MARIARESLLTLEAYARSRDAFRAQVLSHKRHRTVAIGPNVTLVFEDELTMRYQVQEMLRVERIFEEQAIQDEINAYSPMVPDGGNWKATMLIEYPEIEERRRMLARLIDIEDRVWMRVGTLERVYAIADEDLDRETAQKTSSVHFLRFELDPEMRVRLRAGDTLAIGIDHPAYNYCVERLPEATVAALLRDLA